ncbi:MAG: aminopeptidase [Aquificaceae bacterium]|nr:aminopeptidase [Aquificaceae bacterium]MCX8076814.1 aminopeptidase [Aquificaceae bacterium]
MYEKHIYRLYRVNMNLKEDERILLLTDGEKEYLLGLMDEFTEVARGLAKDVKSIVYTPLGQHGKEPPEDVWRLAFGDDAVDRLKELGLFEKVVNKEEYSEEEVLNLLGERAKDVPDVVVAFAYYSTTHTFFRKALTNRFGCRYASMPLFHPDMFDGPMSADWDYVSKLSVDVASILSEAEWVSIKAEGTELEFSVEGRQAVADTGLFHEKGQYGNLPAGEAFIAPIEDSAYGKLRIVYGPDRKLDEPITLTFKKGRVESIEGYDPYRKILEEVFSKQQDARTIAEFGVGTNHKAVRPDNVLEAEKILGTVHVAIGDNHTFGGKNKVSFHTDYVVFEPKVIVGGRGWQKNLLEKGKLRT